MKKELVKQLIKKLVENVEKVIKGKSKAVEMSILCFLSSGHLLIEDLPGVGKTMLAKSIAKSVNGLFKRVQFTPDLLPSDITGITIYDQKLRDFKFAPGPVFANIVLADEINRTTPRTQSALLEAMEERQVTVDGVTHPLPEPFFVIATQNPLEYHGTYPLPEGQLDRFLVSISLGYPPKEAEKEILKSQLIRHPIETLEAVISAEEIVKIQKVIRKIYVEESLIDYALKIVLATRDHPDVLLGSSPRGTISLTRLAQAKAASEGRDYILPDDIKYVATYTLSHRIVLKPHLRLGQNANKELIKSILNQIPVPIGL